MKGGRTIPIIAGLVAGAMLVGAALWLTTPRSEPYYTDADTIRASEEFAQLRDILWQPPELLPAPLNTSERDEYEPALSPDGLTMLFVRGKPGANADLYQSVRTPKGWTEPTPVSSLNTENDELGPAFTPDGQGLYFYSDREGSLGGYDIWFAARDGDGWGKPEHLGAGVNSTSNDYGPALTPDGKRLYFASNRPREGESVEDNPAASWPATIRESFQNRPYDLYVVPIGERGIGQPAIVEALSSAFSEGAPAVSPSGDFIYFASDRPGGEGGFDLYRARIVGDDYFPIEHLSDGVNTEANELDPALGMGGFGLVFSSDRDQGAGRQYDLYRTESREVYRDRELLAARLTWADLMRIVLPWLLLLALLLALLALLRMFATDERWKARWRKLGLLAKCLIVSGLVHALILMLLTLWQVSTHLDGLLGSPGGSKVTLVSSAVGGGIESQILTQITPVPASAPIEMASLAAPELSMERATAEPVHMDAPSPVAIQDSLAPQQIQLRTSAPASRLESSLSPPEPMDIASENPAVALPTHRARRATTEAPLADNSPVIELPEADHVDASMAFTDPSVTQDSPGVFAPIETRDTLPAGTLEISSESRRVPAAEIGAAPSMDFAAETLDPALPSAAPTPTRAVAEEAGIGSPPALREFAPAETEALTLSAPEAIGELSPSLAKIDGIEILELDLSNETPAARDRSVHTDTTDLALTDPGLFELDVALPEGVALPEQVALPRHFSGIVLDDETGLPIADALVRVDSDSGDLVETRTASDGTFALEPKFDADFVAVTASRSGYTPSAMNLPIEDLERGVVREIRLDPVRDTVIALEEDPEVHHLGDNDFGGRINSQFQKASEGTLLRAEFVLSPDQHRALGDLAGVALLAKGLQTGNIIRINGKEVPRRLDRSPSDGSFGEFAAAFDAAWLRDGVNTIEIESQVSSGTDHDDFEIVNIRVLLAPPVEPTPRRNRGSQNML